MTDPLTVTLDGGPCHGQDVYVWPVRGGHMPRAVLVCRPVAPDNIDPIRYHTYVRIGEDDSTVYAWAGRTSC